MADSELPQKRSRPNDTHSAFSEGLLAKTNEEKLRDSFENSKPYLHCKITPLINDELLHKVRDEIMANLHFTVKETDIYKVCQTGDLANLDGLPKEELEKLTSLFELRNALYSSTFRDFISNITDCGPLSGSKTDMSINCYKKGCHLLNHDDVIGTRRVSYILYLPSPGQPWDPKQGGALELYPVIQPGIPATEPSVIIPPQWNQFVMFTVQPGHSFHSVEEVVVDRDRLSISGWFHIPQVSEPGYVDDRDKGNAKSSLEQLESEDTEVDFSSYPNILAETVFGFTAEELEMLGEWISPHYLDVSFLQKIASKFLDESAVECKDFLQKDLADKIAKVTMASDKADGMFDEAMVPHGTGVKEGWTCQGPPHRQRFVVPVKPVDEAATLFLDLQRKFESDVFRRWLAFVTQLSAQGYRGHARRFRPGHDYTLATTNTRGKGILDVTLSLAAMPDASSAALWESGDVGAYECYMAPHDGEEDAAIYKAASEDDALLTLPPNFNSLAIVFRDEGVMRFIKYTSALAPGSRWDVSYEYDVDDDYHGDESVDDADEEEEGEEGEEDDEHGSDF